MLARSLLVYGRSVVSMVDRHGVMEVEDAPPVTVRTASQRGSSGNGPLRIIVADNGGGIPPEDRQRVWDWHFTSTRRRADPDFKYSREFGAALSGLGVGLARAQVFMALHNGCVTHHHPRDGGVCTTLSLFNQRRG